MNLKQGSGLVPIRGRGETPWLLVPMPDRDAFDAIYPRHSPDQRDRLRSILIMRLKGAMLQECSKAFGISHERVRQIEANFQRRLGEHLSTLS
jgi:hypothetical protein